LVTSQEVVDLGSDGPEKPLGLVFLQIQLSALDTERRMKPAQLGKAGIRGTGYQASRLHLRPCVTSGRGVLPVISPFITTIK
jgi:hypothetical protein